MFSGYPPFVSKNRQITRGKIMNWRTSLRFPSRPRISREAQDLITNLICEREDRLGSKASSSASRPNSIIVHRRNSFLLAASPSLPNSLDREMMRGADALKAHAWFKDIDFETLHLQTPPFVPELATPGDTRYFEDDIDAVSTSPILRTAIRR
jgi:protein-serine/threonine kinase